MIHHARLPAAAILLATALAGAVYLYRAGPAQSAVEGPSLAELEVAITQPDAPPATWHLYADRLYEQKRYDHAAAAYRRFLKHDPYHRLANLHCASALARASDAEEFYDFVQRLILADPRLAVEVLGRPESQPYLYESRFQTLLKDARIQAMD